MKGMALAASPIKIPSHTVKEYMPSSREFLSQTGMFSSDQGLNSLKLTGAGR